MNNIDKKVINMNNYLNTLTNIKISYLWKDVQLKINYILFDYRFIKSYNDHRLQRKTNYIRHINFFFIYFINYFNKCIY